MKSFSQKTLAAFLAAVFVLTCAPFTLGAAAADPPGIPGNTNAQYTSSTSILITWSKVTNATGYVVYRRLESEKSYQRVKVTSALSATDTVKAGTLYYYKARAYTKTTGGNIYGTPSAAFTAPAVEFPAIPDNANAVSVNLTSIKTRWDAVPGADGYVLYRSSSSSGTYKRIKVTSALTFTDTGLTPGSTYYYRVRAYTKPNGVAVYGTPSTAFSGLAAPAIPGNYKAVFTSTSSATITWNKVSGATGYVLYFADDKAGPYKRLKVLKGLSYVHNGIDVAYANYYKVRAYQTFQGVNIYGKPTAAFAPKSDPVVSYQYDADGNYFYTEEDPWQRNFGFNPIYDWVAPITAMYYSSVRVKFSYNGLDWMVQLWKGQYGFAFIGSEIGIYHKPVTRIGNHYDCASDENSLKIEHSLYRQKQGSNDENDVELKFTRPYAIYWWSTGFVAGMLRQFSDTGELMMIARITFKDVGMANAFIESFDALGFNPSDSVGVGYPDVYKAVGRDVYINWRYIGRATGTYIG